MNDRVPPAPGLQDPRPVLILGAAGGVGSALSRRLARRGIPLMLAGRSAEPLERLAAEIGGEVRVADARDFGAVDGLVRSLADSGGISGAALCVGSILLKPAHLTSEAEFTEVLSANLVPAFALVRGVGRAFGRPSPRGDAGGELPGGEDGIGIALVSTVAARIGLANHEAIAAAKAGIEGLVRSAAATYAPARIRFNAVAPGLVDTPLAARITGNEKALEASRAMHPLGRIGTADEVARVLEWLVTPDSGWVTGQVIPVDGGLSTVRKG